MQAALVGHGTGGHAVLTERLLADAPVVVLAMPVVRERAAREAVDVAAKLAVLREDNALGLHDFFSGTIAAEYVTSTGRRPTKLRIFPVL